MRDSEMDAGEPTRSPAFRSSYSMKLLATLFMASLLLAGCGPSEGPVGSASEAAPASPSPYVTPDWFANAVVYEIYVRSFADSNGDGIGDLNAIRAQLDYLEALSVDVVWLMPIYPSPSVHGYDVVDARAVRAEYGTMEDLQALVSEAHERGIRVLLDFVPSHVSDENPIFVDAYANPASAFSDWFVWTNDSHTTYATFAGSQDLPRLNHYHPEVVAELLESALFWLDLDGDGDYTDGIDGFRVDNATFPPTEFFLELRRAVKAANPEVLLLGEAWVTTPADLSRFFPNQFDALFDFPYFDLLLGDPAFNQDALLAGDGFPVLLTNLLDEEERRFPVEGYPVRFLSNHDTNRIATEVQGDPARQRLAAALLAAMPGPVMIYYGEEIGMIGQKGGPPHWDSYRREPMEWAADQDGDLQTSWFQVADRGNRPLDGISVEEQEPDPESLLNFYRRVFGLRRTQPALKGTDFQVVELEVSGVGPWSILRQGADDRLLMLANFASEPREVAIPSFPLAGPVVTDLLSGVTYPAPGEGGTFQIELKPAGIVFLISGP